MSRIPLRKYIQEIEVLIESGSLDKALKHCWYILSTYPKHIQTYRLLGKILMERGSYEDSTYVFNKVLDVFPDDFISHVGLSFIAEVNNQLENAVFHMERAFEMQPTNAVLKEELKRLHLKKDGVEPQTIRLTRGALVNMYLRSALYPQAIAELQIGLQTNPNRLDFKEQLADALLKTGDKVEAVQKSIEILGKSPFNFTANKIVYEALPKTSEALDTEAFHQHLVDVDPYFLYVGDKIQEVENVPDVAVNMDRYDGKNPIIDLEKINWQEEIEKFWNKASLWNLESDVASEIDWDSIIDMKLSQEKEKTAEIKVKPTPISEIAEISTEIKEEIEEEIKLEEISDLPDKPNSDIPGWIFDDQESVNKESVSEVTAAVQSETEQPAEETPDIPNIDPIESGMVDHDVPTISAPESEAISKHWVKIESEQLQEKFQHLEDTQKINLQSTQATILQAARTAMDGEDIHSAIQKLDALIEDEFHLEEIIQIMEKSEQFFTHKPEAWFVLGKAYLKNDQKAKALQAFRKAEGNTFI